MAKMSWQTLLLLALLQGSIAYIDQTCSVCGTCPQDNYISMHCTPFTDTVCAPCSSCGGNQYLVNACHNDRDTVCRNCTTCGAQQYTVSFCTANSDTVCSACHPCAPGRYESTACTAVSDTVCTDCTPCPPSSYTSRTCSSTQNSMCSNCSTCPQGRFQVIPCGGVTDVVCDTCDTCRPEEYITAACTQLTDTQCTQCSVCNASQYLFTPCTASSNTVCRACSACPLGSRVITACTATADTVCSFSSLDDTSKVFVSLSPSDISALDRLGFAATPSSTKLAVSASTISDMFSNAVDPIATSNPLSVTNLTLRTVVFPVVQELAVNMNAGFLNITLSRPMNISILNQSRILLQDTPNSPTVQLSLFDATFLTSPAQPATVLLVFSPTTLNAIKSNQRLFTSAANSAVFLDLGAFVDVAGVPLNVSRITARSFVGDVTPPALVDFQFSLNDPVVALVNFSEPISPRSFNFSLVYFSKNSSISGAAALTNATLVQRTTDATSFSIFLSTADVWVLKSQGICIVQSFCFIILANGAFADVSNNSLDSFFLPTSVFTPDTIAPSLSSFLVYDGNAGMITLSFTEPMSFASVNTSSVQLSIGPAMYASTAVYLTGGTINSSRYFTLFSITLTRPDLNTIKSLVMCRSSLQCGLLLDPMFATDVSGNAINAVGDVPPNPADNNQLPKAFLPDSSPPLLSSFDLNMNTQLLTLSFDEPIRLSTFNMTNRLVVQNAASAASINLTLTAPETVRLTAVDISQSVIIQIGGLDTTHLKAIVGIAKTQITTFLTALAGLVRDVALVPNTFRTAVGLAVSLYQADITPPNFVSFSIFDATQGLVALQFSEPVDNITLVGTKLALTSQLSSGQNYTLQGAGTSVYADVSTKTVVYFYMTSLDLLRLRLVPGVAVSASTTFAIVDQSFIADMSGNTIQSSPAKPVIQYVPSARPFVSQFSLDMSSGMLSLTFNVVVNASSVLPREFTLQNDAAGAVTDQFYALTSSSFVNSTSGFLIDIVLGSIDLNAIKTLRSLAKSASSTFLSMTADAFQDTSVPAQRALAVGRTAALGVFGYTPDTVPPQILTFSFALDPCVLLLNFSEVVDLTTLNVTQLTLQLSTSAGPSITLDALSFSPTNVDQFVQLQVPSTVSDTIKSLFPLGTAIAFTFLTASAATITDMAGIALQPIHSSAALGAGAVRADSVAPSITSFNVDLNLGTVLLSFSEYVNLSTFIPAGLALHNNRIATRVSLDSMFTTITRVSFTSALVQLVSSDMNRIRLLAKEGILVNRTTSFLSVDLNAVEDNAGNPLSALASIVAANYAPDTTQPQLLAFEFDFQLNTVMLVFSEVVDASTLQASAIDFQDTRARSQAQAVYRLTNSVTAFAVDGLFVSVNISHTDVMQLQQLYPLCGTPTTTFLALQGGAVRDMYGNSIAATDVANTVNVSRYTPDLVGPKLISFTVDMAARRLVFNFDKPVNVSTFRPSVLTLQSSAASSAGGASYQLTGGEAAASNLFQVALNLSNTDYSAIRLLPVFFTAANTSFLSCSANLVQALTGVFNLAVASTAALQAGQFNGDTSSASIVAFDIDLTANLLTLRFNAVVRASSLRIGHLTLQSAFNAPSSLQVNLVDGVLLTAFVNSSVTFQLNHSVVNLMKQLRVCTSPLSCWLTALDSAALDVFGVGVLGLINGVSALSVSNETPDTVPPALANFDLDMNSAQLRLVFTETILASSLLTASLSFQSQALSSAVLVFLSNSSQTASTDGIQLLVTLSIDDINAIKATGALALAQSNTFLNIAMSAVTDIAGNAVTAVTGAGVRTFTADTTAPALQFFAVGFAETLTLTLTFNEAVNVSTINVTGLTLLPSNSSSQPYTISAAAVSAPSLYSTVLTLTLSPGDENAVKARSPLFSTVASAFLACAQGTVLDVARNALSSILTNSPLQALSVTVGVVRPRLVSFALNMDTGALSLTFSESVNASSLDTSGLTLIEAVDGVQTVALSHVATLSLSGTVLNVTLPDADLNAIKLRLPALANAPTSTFLLASSAAVVNMFGQSLQTRNASNPAVCIALTPDTTPPTILNFSLDMSAASVLVTFSEPVRASTVAEANYALVEGNRSVSVGPFRTRSATNGLVLAFGLTSTVMNALKAAGVGLTSNVQLTAVAGAVADMTGNWLFGTSTPVPVGQFTPDSIAPSLVAYDLDMNASTLRLSFSEPMNAASFNQSCLTLQGQSLAVPGDGTIVPALTSSMLVATVDASAVLVLSIDAADRAKIQTVARACKSANTTFLVATSCMATDVSGNALQPQFPGLPVALYTRDSTPPRFLAFTLDMNTGLLTLTFSEPMQPTSQRRNLLKLQNALVDDGIHNFRLRP